MKLVICFCELLSGNRVESCVNDKRRMVDAYGLAHCSILYRDKLLRRISRISHGNLLICYTPNDSFSFFIVHDIAIVSAFAAVVGSHFETTVWKWPQSRLVGTLSALLSLLYMRVVFFFFFLFSLAATYYVVILMTRSRSINNSRRSEKQFPFFSQLKQTWKIYCCVRSACGNYSCSKRFIPML